MTTTTTIDLNNLQALSAASSTAADARCAVSTVPVETPAGRVLLEMRRRSTKENPVTRENAYRCTLVSDGLFAIDAGAVPSKFAAVLQATLTDLANERFADAMRDAPSALTFDSRLVRTDALLAYWAERKQSQRIDGAAISGWLAQSATLQTLPAAAATVWQQQLPKLAAPSYTMAFTKKQAAAIVARLADADLEHPVAIFVANRCNIILSRDESSAADF